jgi:hypothetical protein
MLNVLVFGVMGLAQVQQHPPQPIALRVVMAVKDDRQVADILAAREDVWEAKAKAMGYTIVPIDRATLAVEKRLWEPVNLVKSIEMLKLLRKVSFADVKSLTDLPAPLQKAILERGNRYVKLTNGGKVFDSNTACTIGAGSEYTLRVDGRTFSSSSDYLPKPGGPSTRGTAEKHWTLGTKTLERAEEKKSSFTMRLSRPVAEERYFGIVQNANATLAKRWAELHKTYADLELAVIGSQYEEANDQIPDRVKFFLTLDAQNAGIGKETVAARGRFTQKVNGIMISLKMPGTDDEVSYFGMGVRDLFELP